MIAIIKNNKKILINMIDTSERALIDDFVRKSSKQEVKITKLFDIDNEPDGVSFNLTGKKQNLIDFKTPCIQIIAANCSTDLDLQVDEETNISVDYTEVENYLEINVVDKIINIHAIDIDELSGTTGQYVFNVTLTKPEYDSVTLSVNVSVLYFGSSISGDYEKLSNLPKINSVTLLGNKELSDLGIQEEMESLKNSDIDDIFNN